MAMAKAKDGEGGVSSSEGLFGFVIVIADFVTPLEAIALARARWCGDREVRIVSSRISGFKTFRKSAGDTPRTLSAAAANGYL